LSTKYDCQQQYLVAAVAHIRDIADTALIGAGFRARESARPRPVIEDPLARRLAGRRGLLLAKGRGVGWIMRTRLVDQMVARAVRDGAGPVVCLGAGFDTRPYRLPLPPTLRWIEADLPAVVARKRKHLAGAKPGCHVRRVAIDLAQGAPRRALLQWAGRSGRAVAVTEGLLIYLTPGEVAALARELAAAAFAAWIVDLVSPATLHVQQRSVGRALARAGAPLLFAPRSAAAFFRRHGWTVESVRSVPQLAARLGRVPQRMTTKLVARGLDSHVYLLRRAR
jgi:methyltransferase (TIGR00027 family)